MFFNFLYTYSQLFSMPVQRFIHTEFLFERLAHVQTFFREKKSFVCYWMCLCADHTWAYTFHNTSKELRVHSGCMILGNYSFGTPLGCFARTTSSYLTRRKLLCLGRKWNIDLARQKDKRPSLFSTVFVLSRTFCWCCHGFKTIFATPCCVTRP